MPTHSRRTPPIPTHNRRVESQGALSLSYPSTPSAMLLHALLHTPYSIRQSALPRLMLSSRWPTRLARWGLNFPKTKANVRCLQPLSSTRS